MRSREKIEVAPPVVMEKDRIAGSAENVFRPTVK